MEECALHAIVCRSLNLLFIFQFENENYNNISVFMFIVFGWLLCVALELIRKKKKKLIVIITNAFIFLLSFIAQGASFVLTLSTFIRDG